MLLCHFKLILPLIWSLQELPLRLAEREGARIVVATDPDADRLAVAEQCDKSVVFGLYYSSSAA